MCLGDDQTGLMWAGRFLQDSRKPHFRFVVAGVVLMLDLIMGIFLRAKQFSLLTAQMEAVEANCVSCPTLNVVLNKYRQQLSDETSQKQVNFESSPSSSSAPAPHLCPEGPDRARHLADRQFTQSHQGQIKELSQFSPTPHIQSTPPHPTTISPVPTLQGQWQQHYSAQHPSDAPDSVPIHNTEPPQTSEMGQFYTYGPGEGQGFQEVYGTVTQRSGDGREGVYELVPPHTDERMAEYYGDLLGEQDEGLFQQFLNS